MKRENRKIIGATPYRYDGIDFKSKFEMQTYKTLSENNIYAEYEPFKFHVHKGHKPKIMYWKGKDTRGKNLKVLKQDTAKVRDITYTPDFIILYNNRKFIMECKGFQTDSYAIKRKLFRKVLDENYGDEYAAFFEVGNLSQVKVAIEIMKKVTQNEGNN